MIKVKTEAYLGVLIHYGYAGLHEAVEHGHVALSVDLVLPKVGVGACVQSHCLPQLLAHIVPLLNSKWLMPPSGNIYKQIIVNKI